MTNIDMSMCLHVLKPLYYDSTYFSLIKVLLTGFNLLDSERRCRGSGGRACSSQNLYSLIKLNACKKWIFYYNIVYILLIFLLSGIIPLSDYLFVYI